MKKNYALAVLFSFLFCFILSNEIFADETQSIGEITVSNIGSNRVTISWITTNKEDAQINYGTDCPFQDMAYDVRDESYKGKTHYITITRLKADTTYYYDVVSGGVKHDNDGMHYTFTTGPILEPAIGSNIVYNQILLNDGKTPAKDVIVDIKLKDNTISVTGDQSELCSAIVDDNGYWCINLKNVRTEDLTSYFDYSKTKDSLIVGTREPDAGITKP